MYLLLPGSCCLFFSVVASNGLWVAPGNSEEVAAALSQALRNSLERYSCILFYCRGKELHVICAGWA